MTTEVSIQEIYEILSDVNFVMSSVSNPNATYIERFKVVAKKFLYFSKDNPEDVISRTLSLILHARKINNKNFKFFDKLFSLHLRQKISDEVGLWINHKDNDVKIFLMDKFLSFVVMILFDRTFKNKIVNVYNPEILIRNYTSEHFTDINISFDNTSDLKKRAEMYKTFIQPNTTTLSVTNSQDFISNMLTIYKRDLQKKFMEHHSKYSTPLPSKKKREQFAMNIDQSNYTKMALMIHTVAIIKDIIKKDANVEPSQENLVIWEDIKGDCCSECELFKAVDSMFVGYVKKEASARLKNIKVIFESVEKKETLNNINILASKVRKSFRFL